ncbi:MAG: DUF5317 domain-containing protein [Coriobacteriia bacterium]|nr:DUF5317 domain-containing protein [Coriobacteriia bacterium]
MLALLSIGVGLAVAWASGGSLRRLAELSIPWSPWILVAFLVQGVARGRLFGFATSEFGFALWCISSTFLVVLLITSWRLPGLWIAAVGLGLNLVVVLANGGMPVSVPETAVLSQAEQVAQSMGLYQFVGVGTIWGFLGDAITFRVMSGTFLLSAGDVLLIVGVAVQIVSATAGAVTSPEHLSDTS